MGGDTADLTPTLVAELRAGRSSAGRRLVELYREPLLRFAWGYLGDLQAAEDAVQDVFARVLETRVVPEDFRAWIYRIARNRCLNLRRGRGRRRDAAPLRTSLDLAARMTGPLTRLSAAEAQERLARALDALPEAERAVLLEVSRRRLKTLNELTRKSNADALEQLKKQGLSVVPPTAAALAAYEEAGRKSRRALAGRLYPVELLERVEKTLEALRAAKGAKK